MKILRSIAALTAAAVMLVCPLKPGCSQHIMPSAAAGQSASENVINLDSAEAAADYLRSGIRKHKAEMSFSCDIPFNSAEKFFGEIVESLFIETGRGSDGDYLRYGIKELHYKYHGNYAKVTYTVNIIYFTTAAQESYVEQKVKSVSESLGLENKSDYGKVYAIYDWIVKNVSYADDTSKNEVYSAYGALANGKAVCQGFAQLFYRLAMDAGISCRIIGGTAGGANHAWLIAALNGSYYLLDPTWDSHYKGKNKYYFLRGTSDFDSDGISTVHVTGVSGAGNFFPDYNSAEFKKYYPIQKTMYSATNKPASYSLGDINNDGIIDGTDATLILRAYGQLNSYGNCGITAIQRLAADVNSDGVIDGTDATIVLKYFSYRISGNNVSFKDFIAS